MIAMMLITDPELIIADEPTSCLLYTSHKEATAREQVEFS